MASWPGIRGKHSSPTPLTGDPWADNRSEIYLPRRSSFEGPLNEWNELRRRRSLANSTSPGTVQPLSPDLSKGSPPRTSPALSAYTFISARHNGIHESTGNSSQAQSKEQRRAQSLTSSHCLDPISHRAVSASDSAKMERLMDEVLKLHDEVSTERFQLRDMRNALRYKREEEDDLRLALRNKLNVIPSENLHREATAINKIIEELQAVTAAYLVLEADYHKVEDELGEREYILEKRMRTMHQCLRKQTPIWTHNFHDENDYESNFSDDYSSASGLDPVSPTMAEYLSWVGEVRMLRERLSVLEAEYLDLVDRQQVRARMGISLDKEALDFVDRYESEKSQIETELSLAINKVRSHPEFTDHATSEVREKQRQQVLKQYLPDPPEEPPAHDLLRLSEFEDRSSFFESSRSAPLNKATFVNRWLLHRLRHSGLEILQFKSQPELLELMNHGWSSDNVSQMALMLWFHDETANMVPARSYSGG